MSEPSARQREVAPRGHGHAGPSLENLAQLHGGAEPAHVGDDADGGVRVRKERKDALHPHLGDFVVDGMAHRLAETEIEEPLRDGEARDEAPGRQPVARIPPDGLDRLQHPRFAASVPARGLPVPHENRPGEGRGGGRTIAGRPQKPRGKVAGKLEIDLHGRNREILRPFRRAHAVGADKRRRSRQGPAGGGEGARRLFRPVVVDREDRAPLRQRGHP